MPVKLESSSKNLLFPEQNRYSQISQMFHINQHWLQDSMKKLF